MRKLSILLSLVVIFSFILAACGGVEEQPTEAVVETPSLGAELPDTGITGTETAEVITTEAPAAAEVEAPTLAATETTGRLLAETPAVAETAMPGSGVMTTPFGGFPPFGLADPSRLTTLMTFEVRNANGDTLATVDDMVIDLGSSQILHVVLASGGFLGIGESLIPVPWDIMQVNPECVTAAMSGMGTTTGGAAATGTPGAAGSASTGADTCFFLLNVDDETLRNAPNVDLDNLPDHNTPDWDIEFNTYWETTGGTTGSEMETTATPGAGETTSTATPTPGGTTGAQTGSLILASDLLGMEVTGSTVSSGGTTGGPTAGAAVTETSAAGGTSGTAAGTATPGTGETTGGLTGQGEALGVVSDAVVDLQTGMIRYLLVAVDSTTPGTTGSLVPVPAQAFQAGGDTQTQMLTLNVEPSVLTGAPAFEEGTFPNATVEGWDAELNTYWETQGFTSTTSP
jgi:sporulation protein YlmC with PRC-barrel domain